MDPTHTNILENEKKRVRVRSPQPNGNTLFDLQGFEKMKQIEPQQIYNLGSDTPGASGWNLTCVFCNCSSPSLACTMASAASCEPYFKRSSWTVIQRLAPRFLLRLDCRSSTRKEDWFQWPLHEIHWSNSNASLSLPWIDLMVQHPARYSSIPSIVRTCHTYVHTHEPLTYIYSWFCGFQTPKELQRNMNMKSQSIDINSFDGNNGVKHQLWSLFTKETTVCNLASFANFNWRLRTSIGKIVWYLNDTPSGIKGRKSLYRSVGHLIHFIWK